jgi:hypothetical protein
MQRAREGVLWLRGTRGILQKTRAIVQNAPQKAQRRQPQERIEAAKELKLLFVLFCAFCG